jgi:predicted transcriptional regulator
MIYIDKFYAILSILENNKDMSIRKIRRKCKFEKNIDISEEFTSKLIKMLSEKNFVTVEKLHKHLIKVNITERGKKYLDAIKQLKKEIEELENANEESRNINTNI